MRSAAKDRRAAAGHGFLDPVTLARIDGLDLLARTVVDGFINGLHRSPYLGLSLDFAEHRPYNPGDDIRRIDWKLFARTDRYYVKEFEAETNSDFTVVLDTSASMDYTSDGLTKLDYGRYLAASLAYFSRQQRDRVGLVTFDVEVIDFVPPSARHLEVVLHTLDRVTPGARRAEPAPDDSTSTSTPEGAGGGGPGLSGALEAVAERIRRRGIVALVSDLYEDPDRVAAAVRRLRHGGNDVMVFHVLDPAELEFPFEAASQFEDLETGERIPVVPDTMRERYRRLMDAHVSRLAKLFTDDRVDYALFDTATPLDYALFRYLSDRERLSRVR